MGLVQQLEQTIKIKLITKNELDRANISDNLKKQFKREGFKAKEGQISLAINQSGDIEQVYFGVSDFADGKYLMEDFFNFSNLKSLPEGNYEVEGVLTDAQNAYFAYQLAHYQFSRYKKDSEKGIKNKIKVPSDLDLDEIMAQVEAISLTRDLINTPANDMGPVELAASIKTMADQFGATYRDIIGDDLLEQNFNMIHAVGRASDRPPHFIELKWAKKDAENPLKLCLVGKGVVFDTGGLDLKPPAGMILMKKDMGGAANVIGLAHMIMSQNLNVELTLLVGAVENAVSSNAMRPSDVLKSYKGITVEIGNTDAEGRLVLADLLAYGDERETDLMIDMATLTGAARVAVGTEIAAYFTKSDVMAFRLNQISKKQGDPVWQLPMHQPYFAHMKSKVADINNIGSSPMGGATTAALFLDQFVENAKDYVHFDINGWNVSERKARPVGGEAMGIRTLFEYIKERADA